MSLTLHALAKKFSITERESLQLLIILVDRIITLNKLSNGTVVIFYYSSSDVRIFTREKLKQNKGFHSRYSQNKYTFRKSTFHSTLPNLERECSAMKNIWTVLKQRMRNNLMCFLVM